MLPINTNFGTALCQTSDKINKYQNFGHHYKKLMFKYSTKYICESEKNLQEGGLHEGKL